MRIAICDDERYWIDHAMEFIQRWSTEHNEPVTFETFGCGADLLDYIYAKGDLDLILLDIGLNETVDGIELSRTIRETGLDVAIIFVSGYVLCAAGKRGLFGGCHWLFGQARLQLRGTFHIYGKSTKEKRRTKGAVDQGGH